MIPRNTPESTVATETVKPIYKPNWDLHGRHGFDYSEVSFFNLNARKEEMIKMDVGKMSEDECEWFHQEAMVVRNEWDKRVGS